MAFVMSLHFHEDCAAQPDTKDIRLMRNKVACHQGAKTEMGAAINREEFYRKLTTEAADAIIYADAKGAIRFWNNGAERIFGFSSLEALGNSLDIIIPERLRQRHWEGYARTIRTGFTRYGAGDVLAVPAVRKDGLVISVEFTILPFTGPDEQLIGIAAILRDVSVRFNMIKDLRRKLAAAQAANSASECSPSL